MALSKITDAGCIVIFRKEDAEVIHPDGTTALRATQIDDLYYVDEEKCLVPRTLIINTYQILALTKAPSKKLKYKSSRNFLTARQDVDSLH